ncbi:MAG: hypothetical protein JW981_02050 [Anaerolineae bacterium]|nr:hypothetical protein [Anaerolineae bacterium]
MLIEEYYQLLLDIVKTSPTVSTFDITLDKRAAHIGLIRGEIYFINKTQLYFRELVKVEVQIVRHMYSYHYQNSDKELIFRYDDTPHHHNLKTFPHHKHSCSESNVIEALPPTLDYVLQEIERLIALD